MPLESITRPELRRRIAAALQDDIVHGTATGGTTTTLVDTAKLDLFSDDALNGAWVYINAGTDLADERAITDFTQSTGTITVTEPFTSGPDTTSVYEVHRKFTVEQYDAAIDQALVRSRWSHQIPLRVRLDISNSGLRNPLFEITESNTTPVGWSVSSDGLQQALIAPSSYTGKTFKVSAMVWADTAARMVLMTPDGNTTATHTGSGKWELLEADWTPTGFDGTGGTYEVEFRPATDGDMVSASSSVGLISGRSTRLVTTSGAAVRIDWVYVPAPETRQTYQLNLRRDTDEVRYRLDFAALNRVKYSAGMPTESSPSLKPDMIEMSWHDWDVQEFGPDESSGEGVTGVVFHNRPPSGRVLEYWGTGSELTGGDNDDVLRINSEVIELYALYRLTLVTDPARAQLYMDEWRRIRNETQVKFPAYSKMVDPI